MENVLRSPVARLVRARLLSANCGMHQKAWQQAKNKHSTKMLHFPVQRKGISDAMNQRNIHSRWEQIQRSHEIHNRLRSAATRRHLSYNKSSWPAPTGRKGPSKQPNMRVSSNGYTHFGNSSPATQLSPTARYILICTAAGISYYVYSNIDYAPFTGRVRLIGGVSRESELALGRDAFEDLLNSFNGHVLPAEHRVSKRVRRVVARLAGTVRNMDSSLCDDFQWSVAVADVEEPNAMCAPGGRIVITTGLLRILPSDDDLAIILGHEISHALNRHGVETLSLRRIIWPLVFLINQIFDMRVLPSLFATVFLSLPYSRRLEYEADAVGLLLCTEACYNPEVAPDVFKRLAALQNENDKGGMMNKKVATLFSTHPHTMERAYRLEKKIPEQMRRYNDKCVHGMGFDQFSRR